MELIGYFILGMYVMVRAVFYIPDVLLRLYLKLKGKYEPSIWEW